jgi:hypothetical protein
MIFMIQATFPTCREYFLGYPIKPTLFYPNRSKSGVSHGKSLRAAKIVDPLVLESLEFVAERGSTPFQPQILTIND